jgi:hypothetical protein
MTTLLLALFLTKSGELQFQARVMPSMEVCIEAIYDIGPKMPDTVRLMCVQVRREDEV